MSEEDAQKQLEEAVRQGGEAERIVTSSLFQSAWTDLREMYIREAVGFVEPQERLNALHKVEVLESVKAALQGRIKVGKASEHMLTQPDDVV